MSNENKSIMKAINMFGRVPEQYELLEEIERLNKIIDKYDKELKHKTEQYEFLRHGESKEIERLNNILDEIDLMFYRMRFVEFNSINDELIFLNENINEVRKICQNKKLKGDGSNE